MTASRSNLFLLLVAGFALAAGGALAEPVETPPAAPPAGAPSEAPEGPPPGAGEEEAPTSEMPPPEDLGGLDLSNAAPGRMPSTDGPALPSVIGRTYTEAGQQLGAWRMRHESVVTARSYVGRVVDMHPDAGTTLAPGEVVTLVIGVPSLPSRQHRSVPDVETMRAADAVARVREAGFDVMLRVAESRESAAGRVIAQAPRPMSIDRVGAKVVVVVGTGGVPDPVEPVVEAPAVVADVTAPPCPPESTPPGMDETPPPPLPAEEPTPTMPAVPAEPPPTEPPTEEPTPGAPAEEPTVAPPAEPPPTEPPVEEPPPAVVPDEPETVAPPAPAIRLSAPDLVSPASGQSYPRAFGSTFTWKPVPHASQYEWELQVEARDGTWSTATTEVVDGSRYRPKRMEAGRYRWRVRALAEGVEGAWSPFFRLYMYGP